MPTYVVIVTTDDTDDATNLLAAYEAAIENAVVTTPLFVTVQRVLWPLTIYPDGDTTIEDQS